MPIDFKMTSELFERDIQGKKPHLFKNAISDHNIDWPLINELIGRHDHTSSNFKILNNGLILKYDYLEQYQEVFSTKYRVTKSKLYDLMKAGASLALNKIENCPQTNCIRTQISNFTGRQTVVSGYVAFGSEPSFGNHWDTHDVFAIQLIGKKRWTIYEPTENNPLYKNSSVGKEHQCTSAPVMDITLEAGDVFYLPRGWWHEVTASGDETFHLAIGTYPPYVTDYLNWLIEDISTKFETFRMPLDQQSQADDILGKVMLRLQESVMAATNQQSFLQWFNSQQRVESPYAIELFGNPNTTSIPSGSLVALNANNSRLWHGNEFIANGVKLKLDELGTAMFKKIAQHGMIRLDDLIGEFPSTDPDELRALITEMIKLDVLSIHAPSTKKTEK